MNAVHHHILLAVVAFGVGYYFADNLATVQPFKWASDTGKNLA